MSKPYLATIKGGWDHPYLGVYENEISVKDFADLDENAEFINFNVKVKNLHLLPSFKSIRFVGIGSVTPELITLLSKLPRLEVLNISHCKDESWPSFKPLTVLKYLILHSIKKITSLDFLKNMNQLESLLLSEVLKLNDISALKTTPNIRELLQEGSLHGQNSKLPNAEALFALTKLEYLSYYAKQTEFNAPDFAAFKNLSYLRLSPKRHPFEFYAELEKYVPATCEKIYGPLIYFYTEELCEKCGSQNSIVALGLRQRQFCPACNSKKLDKLLATYEAHSGKPAHTAIEHIPFLKDYEYPK